MVDFTWIKFWHSFNLIHWHAHEPCGTFVAQTREIDLIYGKSWKTFLTIGLELYRWRSWLAIFPTWIRFLTNSETNPSREGHTSTDIGEATCQNSEKCPRSLWDTARLCHLCFPRMSRCQGHNGLRCPRGNIRNEISWWILCRISRATRG